VTTLEQLAKALAELAVKAYRGKPPPTNVLKALGVLVATASKSGTVAEPKKPASHKRKKANGQLSRTSHQ
jgi:glucose-6-phosphate isomerase